jgi:hypothetical protein
MGARHRWMIGDTCTLRRQTISRTGHRRSKGANTSADHHLTCKPYRPLCTSACHRTFTPAETISLYTLLPSSYFGFQTSECWPPEHWQKVSSLTWGECLPTIHSRIDGGIIVECLTRTWPLERCGEALSDGYSLKLAVVPVVGCLGRGQRGEGFAAARSPRPVEQTGTRYS